MCSVTAFLPLRHCFIFISSNHKSLCLQEIVPQIWHFQELFMISPPKNRMVTWFFFLSSWPSELRPPAPPRKLADVGSAAMFGGCLSGGAASDDSFVNPVLPGGFPDPSVCRVSWSTKKTRSGFLGVRLGVPWFLFFRVSWKILKCVLTRCVF